VLGMDRRAVVTPWAVRPRHDGATRNARRSLDEWARAQGAVTASGVRAPRPAAPSPGPAAAPSLARAARGH
jgi:hypothetical protein